MLKATEGYLVLALSPSLRLGVRMKAIEGYPVLTLSPSLRLGMREPGCSRDVHVYRLMIEVSISAVKITSNACKGCGGHGKAVNPKLPLGKEGAGHEGAGHACEAVELTF